MIPCDESRATKTWRERKHARRRSWRSSSTRPFPFVPLSHSPTRDEKTSCPKKSTAHPPASTTRIDRSSCERTQPVLRLPSKLTVPLPSLYPPSPFSVHLRRLDQGERKVEGPLVDLMVVSLAPNPQKTSAFFFIFFFNPQDYKQQYDKHKVYI